MESHISRKTSEMCATSRVRDGCRSPEPVEAVIIEAVPYHLDSRMRATPLVHLFLCCLTSERWVPHISLVFREMWD